MPPQRRRPTPVRRPKVAGRYKPGHTGEFPAIRSDTEPPEREDDAITGVLDGVLGAPPRPADEPTDEATEETRPRRTERRVDDRVQPRKRAATTRPETGPTTADDDRDAAIKVGLDTQADETESPASTRSTGRSANVSDRRPGSGAVKREIDDRRRAETPGSGSGARRSTPAGAVHAEKRPVDADRRPAGKRRSTGSSRLESLTAAETSAGAETARTRVAVPRGRASRQVSIAIVLLVTAVVLGGLAVFFRGQANDLTSGDSNTAMTDMGATTQVKSQLTEAVNKTFSYNYTDLDSTAKAVRERLSDKALCEYNLLFGDVKKYAPQQKIILNTEVRDLGVVRIDGDRAEALVYIDQVSTRVDVNKTVSVRGQFAVQAHRAGDRWKITKFDMFGQSLFNGKPAPVC